MTRGRHSAIVTLAMMVYSFVYLSAATITFVDLNPPGVSSSVANSLWYPTQLGYVVKNGRQHAASWNSTAESFFDLHPPGSLDSVGNATMGTMHGGYATFATVYATNMHAMVWFGTPPTPKDLHPSAAIDSSVQA